MRKKFLDILNRIAKSQIDDTTDPVDNNNPTVLQGACCTETWGGEVQCRPLNIEIPPNKDPQLYIEAFCEGDFGRPGEPGVDNNTSKRGVFTPGATCNDINCYEVLGIEQPGPSGPTGPGSESCKSLCRRTMEDCIEEHSIRLGCPPTRSLFSLQNCLRDKYRDCLAETDPLTAFPRYGIMRDPKDYFVARCRCDIEYGEILLEASNIVHCYKNEVGSCITQEESCREKLNEVQDSFLRIMNKASDAPNCKLLLELWGDPDNFPTDLDEQCKILKRLVDRITKDFDKSNNAALNECLDSKDRYDHCGRCQCGKDHVQRKEFFDYGLCQHSHRVGCISDSELEECEPDLSCFRRPEECNRRTREDCILCGRGAGQPTIGPRR